MGIEKLQLSAVTQKAIEQRRAQLADEYAYLSPEKRGRMIERHIEKEFFSHEESFEPVVIDDPDLSKNYKELLYGGGNSNS